MECHKTLKILFRIIRPPRAFNRGTFFGFSPAAWVAIRSDGGLFQKKQIQLFTINSNNYENTICYRKIAL